MKIEDNDEILNHLSPKGDKQDYLNTPVYVKSKRIEWFVYNSWDTDYYNNMEEYYNSPERIIEVVNTDTERKIMIAKEMILAYLDNYNSYTIGSLAETIKDVLKQLTDLHPFFGYMPCNSYVRYNMTFGKQYLEDQILFYLYYIALTEEPKIINAAIINLENEYLRNILWKYYKPVIDILYEFENEEDYNVAFNQAAKRFSLIKNYKASPLDNLSVTTTWFKAHMILLASPTFKKHPLSFTIILKNYIKYLPNDIKKSVKKFNLQNNSNILTADLIKQLFDLFNLFDDNSPEINNPQKMVNFYSLLSKRYKETTNAYNDFKFEVNSFELLLYLYLKWFYEKQKNINYCLFCGRFYIPSTKSQKTCHYQKLDNMKKRCDELTSDERYEGSKIIPVKHTKRQIQKRFDSRMRSNENAQSIWDTARAEFGNDCDEIIRNYDNDFYDEELQKKIEELYSRIVKNIIQKTKNKLFPHNIRYIRELPR